MTVSYLSIIDRLLVRGRAIIRESYRYFKVYLPTEYNDVWKHLHREKGRVDFIVFLPEPVSYVDKVPVFSRRLTKESDRYKLYLPKKYTDMWGKLYRENKRVDILVVLKRIE
uniref:Uncharacterized protein n=1 Tax=Fervidicoccus fontis TaxID=683846 RepID=A0A7J3ZM35_9CREN